MDKRKSLSIGEKIIFLLLVLFPFGQLLRSNLVLLGKSIVVQPIDIVALCTIPLLFLPRLKKPHTIAFTGFFVALIFSFLFSLTLFKPLDLVPGALYLLRVMGYFGIFVVAWNISDTKGAFRDLIVSALFFEAIAVGLFGWFQYSVFPDLRSLILYGWDDHLFRLVSTFLDPGFTGLILSLGFVISLARYLKRRSATLALSTVFFLVTIGFTYSRASYLALLAGALTLFYLQKKIRLFLFVFLGLVLVAIFLPRPQGEGVHLERLSSIYKRIWNYEDSIQVIKKFPLFGVGYNNLCEAKIKYLGATNSDSHACSGFDSSILLILATLGVAGLIIFVYLIVSIWKLTTVNFYGTVFKSSLAAIFVHSLFVNSLFYPWVLAWMGLLLGASFRERS